MTVRGGERVLFVFYANIDSVPDRPDGLLLSSYRLEKLAACRSAQRRRQGIGAELLLIHALRAVSPELLPPLSIAAEPDGKPCLNDSDLHFSLSHSGSFAACALSDHPVGLDLEKRGRMRESLLRRSFSPEEQTLIRSSQDSDLLFTRIWTGKESFVKATGQGILSPLREIQPLNPPAGVSYWHKDLESFCISVCVLGFSAEPDRCEQINLP